MTQQTFPVGTQPRLQLSYLQDDLEVATWDVDTIGVETDGEIEDLRLEGDVLYLRNSSKKVELLVPANTVLFAEKVAGDVRVRGIRLIERVQDVSGDVEIADIAEAVTLESIEGELKVSDVSVLEVFDTVRGDVTLSNVGKVELEDAEADFTVDQAELVVVGAIGGDLKAQNVSSTLRCGLVRGDCHVQGGPDAEVSLGQVSGDVRIEGAASVQLGNVDGDCHIQGVQHKLSLGNCSGDAHVEDVAGPLELGATGGDAFVKHVQGRMNFGCVSGNLKLEAAFPADSRTNAYVGGDATITLPVDVNLRMQAWINGDLNLQADHGLHSQDQGKWIGLIYGEGLAKLSLVVGGDLTLQGGAIPSKRSVMGGFAQEMAGFASSMSHLVDNLSGELLESLSGLNEVVGSRMSEKIVQRMQAQMERARQRMDAVAQRGEAYANKQAEKARKYAEKQTYRAEKRAEKRSRADRRWSYAASGRGGRRDWPFDPEQIERLKEQARQAANEGLVGAMDAVEQALSGLHFPFSPPPMPPMPPFAPGPPAGMGFGGPGMPPPPAGFGGPGMPPPPAGFGGPGVPPSPAGFRGPVTPPPAPDFSPTGTERPAEGTGRAESTPTSEPQSASMLDQKREAILRMIAEGRISPEEGDMLLSGLE